MDYVVSVEVLHSLEELFHEALDYGSISMDLFKKPSQTDNNIPSLSENRTFA